MMVVKIWLVFLVFLSGCLSRPSREIAVHEEENSEPDYDNPYDDYSDDHPYYDPEDVVSELDVASFPARFVSKVSQRRVERGQTAILNCAVESSGGGTIMWRRDNRDFLFVDKKPMKQEGRKYGIELLEKKDYKGSKLILTSVSKLIIRETNSNDTGSYLCTETASQPPQNQLHYLEVKEPGRFEITGILDPRREEQNLDPWIDELLKKEKSVSISAEKADHRIKCAFTDRNAKIRWTRPDKSSSDNPDLRINRRKDSGTYVCHAGRHKKTVEVIVQYPPEVKIEQIHLTSQRGRQEFWVRCNVTSSPAANVTWSRDGKELAEGEKDFVQEVEGSQHTLQIASSLGAGTMGNFSCTASTNLGSVVETTIVTGLPCNDPRPLEGSFELVDYDPEDETVKVELCSNDDIRLSSKLHVDKNNQHFGSETNYPDYKPNDKNADAWLFEGAQPDDGTGDVRPNIFKYKEYTHVNGEGKETNMIDEADMSDVDKPDVYFESSANEVEMGDRVELRKPIIAYYDKTAQKNSKKTNTAEEVRLNGKSSRGLYGDHANNEIAEEKNSKKTKNPDEVVQTRVNLKKQKNTTFSSKKEVEARSSAGEKNSKLDATHSLTNNSSRVVKENKSKGKKKSKRVMSSPWILILTILFLFILACIILAVLR